MTQTYRDLRPTFDDPATWTVPMSCANARKRTASESTWTFPSKTSSSATWRRWARAEQIATSFLRAGAAPGDRVLIMAPNCSQVILTWLASSLAGLAEVPINTAYVGSFLDHQVRTTTPRLAVIHAEFAERFLASAEATATIECFYLLGDPDARAVAAAALAAQGRTSEPFESLLGRRRGRSSGGVAERSCGRVLHVRDDRAVEGRDDAALAAVLLRRRDACRSPGSPRTTST